MLIYTDGSKINEDDIEILTSGGESDIYKIKNEDKVLKLYFDEAIDNDVITIANRLINIKLRNFVFPDEIVLKNGKGVATHKFAGYTMRYINSKSIEGLFTASSDIVHKNMYSLRDQIEETSKHKIIINDFIPLNTLYCNDEVYVVDSSLYGYEPRLDPDIAYSINMGKYNSYFRKLFYKMLPMCDESTKSISKIDDVTEGDYLSYVDENLKDDDNLLLLTKRILKK